MCNNAYTYIESHRVMHLSCMACEQGLLAVLRAIADKHSSVKASRSHQDTTEGSGNTSMEGSGRISVANVAARWVLQQAGVGAVILGSHLQHTRHVQENLKASLVLSLSTEYGCYIYVCIYTDTYNAARKGWGP